MLSVATQPLLCSFCRKPQSAVQKLVASPSESIRAYICDECISACANIVKEDAVVDGKVEPGHALLEHELMSDLLSAIEFWIKQESLGLGAAEELGAVRAIASQMLVE